MLCGERAGSKRCLMASIAIFSCIPCRQNNLFEVEHGSDVNTHEFDLLRPSKRMFLLFMFNTPRPATF